MAATVTDVTFVATAVSTGAIPVAAAVFVTAVALIRAGNLATVDNRAATATPTESGEVATQDGIGRRN